LKKIAMQTENNHISMVFFTWCNFIRILWKWI